MTAEGPDEQPLDLRHLSEVSSPEVVREAVRRFRRRVLLRSAWLLLAVLVGAGLFLLLSPRGAVSVPIQFRQAPPGHGLGTVIEQDGVRVALVEAKRFGEDVELVGVRALVASEEIEPGEELVAGFFEGTIEVHDPERGGTGPGDPPPAPPSVHVLTDVGDEALELLLTFHPGTEGFSFDVGAAAIEPSSRGRARAGPPAPRVRRRPQGDEVRPLTTIEVDVPELGIPEEVWGR